MARYNEILVGRYNRALQKLLSMKGPASIVSISDQIVPSFSLFYGAENRYLEGWYRYGLTVVTALPLAGNRSAVRIRMNAGTNAVGVLERISVTKVTALSLPLLFVNSIATVMPTEDVASYTAPSIDVRQQQSSSQAIISSSINFGILGTGVLLRLPCSTTVAGEYIFTDIQELPLVQGSQYTVVDDTLVDQMLVSFMWRERFLEDSERT